MAKGDDIWPFLCRRPFLQNRRRAFENDKTAGGPMSASFSALHSAEKHSADGDPGAGSATGVSSSDPSTGSSCRTKERNTSISSRSDSGSFDPPAWFCSILKRPTSPASFRSLLSKWRTWAFVKFSSLLTEATAETQNSLPLCCLRRSRMISASPMYANGEPQKSVQSGQDVNAGLPHLFPLKQFF